MPQPASLCPSVSASCRVILKGAWSIGACAVPLKFREERKSTELPGLLKARCDQVCFAPFCPRLVFPSKLGSGGISRADHVVGLQSCAAAQIPPMCSPLSVIVSQRCRPIVASSGMGCPLKSPSKKIDVRHASYHIVFVTWSQKCSLCSEGPLSCGAYPAKIVRSLCACQLVTSAGRTSAQSDQLPPSPLE